MKDNIYASEYEDFYFIDAINNVRYFNLKYSELEKRKFKEVGNAFKRKEDAERQARAEKLMRELTMFSNCFQDKDSEKKYIINYIKDKGILKILPKDVNHIPFGAVIFSSWEAAYSAIVQFTAELIWYFEEYLGLGGEFSHE